MSAPLVWIVAIAVAYLLGSIPTGYLLVRLFHHQDVRETGSGNIGATNVARTGSKGLGIATLVLDALKGFVAVLIAQTLAVHAGFPQGYEIGAVAGFVVIFGHIFPVWLGFRGGKGVATALGVFLAITPLAGVSIFLIFCVVFAITRFVSLASITAAISYGVITLATDTKHLLVVDLVYVAIPLLVVTKHHGNIRRLLTRTEPKFGSAAANAEENAA